MKADQIIGERVHILMRRNGFNQSQLGEVLAIDQSSVSKKLLGRRTWTIDEVFAAARWLDVAIADLMPGDDYAPVLEGRGRSAVGAVRSKGLEPPTFWLVAGQYLLALAACQVILDAKSAFVKTA